VRESVVHEVFVDLVGDDDQIVLDGNLADTAEFVVGEHGAGRVVRGVDQQDLGAWGDGGAEFVEVEAVVRGAEGDRDTAAAGEGDAG
jgi:hypothetical protein